MPVGMLEAAVFETVRIKLEPGDKLVIYSDGLTEAANAQGQFFETARLRQCLKENAHKGAQGLHQAVMEAVGRFCGDTPSRDDITALVIEYAPIS
jgi:sigma-B regulation protein RsbU (phosphoserine phosphatase)